MLVLKLLHITHPEEDIVKRNCEDESAASYQHMGSRCVLHFFVVKNHIIICNLTTTEARERKQDWKFSELYLFLLNECLAKFKTIKFYFIKISL
jgi:hypothetical protein